MGAKCRELVAKIGSHVSDKCFTSVDSAAKSYFNLLCGVKLPLLHPFGKHGIETSAQIKSGADGILSVFKAIVVFVVQHTEERHDTIADKLVEDSRVSENGTRGFVEVFLQKSSNERWMRFQDFAEV